MDTKSQPAEVILSMRVSPDLHARIKALAVREDRSMSAQVRRLLADQLDVAERATA